MRFAIIGSATPDEIEYEMMLKNLAHKDPRVIFLGRRVGIELAQLIANGYAMVHPSRSEGLSVAVLEGMSYGKVVVMSDIPENLELVDHSGVSFAVGDLKALQDALAWVISDPMLVKTRGHRAREVVRRLYSWDSVVERTEALYFSLLRV